MSKTKMARCASPLAYCPVYTAPTPKGKNPARIPATVGFGPLPLPGGGGGGGTYPGAPGENVLETHPEAPLEPADCIPGSSYDPVSGLVVHWCYSCDFLSVLSARARRECWPASVRAPSIRSHTQTEYCRSTSQL